MGSARYVLGISALYHDAAAALLRDGELVAAAQEERFTRVKFDHRLPTRAINYCLQHEQILPQDLEWVVFYEKPLLKFERLLMSHLATFPSSWRVFREAMLAWFKEKLWVKSFLAKELSVPPERILFVEHHVSHAASAMFCSPFEEAAVVTADGVGEWTTTSIGRATGNWGGGTHENAVTLTHETRFPHSLGLLYSAFTAWLGFRVNSGEYKVMGMAPYGEPRYLDKLDQLIQVFPDGSFRLDMSFFSFHHSLKHTYSQKFVDLFGPARQPETPFFTRRTGHVVTGQEEEADRNQYYADVAASMQRLTEDIMLKVAIHAHEQTGSKNLVMAGGVALNSVANGRIVRETPFEQVYIQPNAGDAGGALGAALHVWHAVLGEPRQFVMEHPYYGQAYSDAEIRRVLHARGIPFQFLPDDEELAGQVARELADGRVIGFFQGRFEWGPRALGNRSILADPRRREMADLVNTKVKFREAFRPFAPVLPAEDASRYFDLTRGEGQYPPRFMLIVAPAVAEKAEEIPAVVHMGTGRLQVVDAQSNPLYYDIIRRFGDVTGTPVLLNTSFNLRSEPIVASPADALNTFNESGLDVLVMGHFLVTKDDLRPERRIDRVAARPAIPALEDTTYVEGLSCPACTTSMVLKHTGDSAILCRKCGRRFEMEQGIPLLFWPTEEKDVDNVTELVKSFYEENPFPGYEGLDTAERLTDKARKSIFGRLLDDQIPNDAVVLEVGCGTGQLSNFLATRGRTVFGADMCLNSLKLARSFSMDNLLDSVHFVQMNLFKPVFPERSVDVLICNGVLHHTEDPFRGFTSIASLVRPGGYVVIGLYNKMGRIWTDLRRLIFRLSGDRFQFLDPYLARSDVESDKKRTWFMDQYRNPHESKHSIDEVLQWFDTTGIEFSSSIPKPSPLGAVSEYEPLFRPSRRGSRLEHLLAQLRLAATGDEEGGFFVLIGKKAEEGVPR